MRRATGLDGISQNMFFICSYNLLGFRRAEVPLRLVRVWSCVMRYPSGSGPASRGPRHDIFFALHPPLKVANAITCFTDRMFETGILRGPRVACERLHITLNGLGSYSVCPAPLIAKASKAVADLKRPSFKLALNCLRSFDNNPLRPRVMSGDDGLIGIDMLYDEIYLMLRRSGLRFPHPRITPHLTLSRERNLLPEDFIEPVVWPVREFLLIDSLQGQSRHQILGRWQLIK